MIEAMLGPFSESIGRVGVGLQVRLESSRLPRKAALSIGSTTILGLTLTRLSRIPSTVHLILTDYESKEEIRSMSRSSGFIVHGGDPDNVLSRYTNAIRAYNLETIIRATGDNPFVFTQYLPDLVAAYEAEKADYAVMMGLPYGAGVELVRATALLRAERECTQAAEREHVCPFLYNNPQKFRILRLQAPAEYFAPDLRITVDTLEDYQRAKDIHNRRGEAAVGDDKATIAAALSLENARISTGKVLHRG